MLLLPAAAASSSLFAAFMGFSSMPALSSPAPRHGQKGAMACINIITGHRPTTPRTRPAWPPSWWAPGSRCTGRARIAGSPARLCSTARLKSCGTSSTTTTSCIGRTCPRRGVPSTPASPRRPFRRAHRPASARHAGGGGSPEDGGPRQRRSSPARKTASTTADLVSPRPDRGGGDFSHLPLERRPARGPRLFEVLGGQLHRGRNVDLIVRAASRRAGSRAPRVYEEVNSSKPILQPIP